LEYAAFAACRFRGGAEVVTVAPGEPTATIVAVGDVALSAFGDGQPERRAVALAAVEEQLGGADLRLANLETVLTRRDERVGRMGSYLRADPEAIEVLERGGFDVVTCANNHCLDFGPEALRDSAERLRAAGLSVCGVGATPEEARAPVVRTVNGVRVGVLGYCDDWKPVGEEPTFMPAGAVDADILADIAALRARVDVVVLQLHWGWEWAVHPLLTHRDRARRFAESGADLVLCHHAHVPMAVEAWGRSLIAHGLGNFLFPWSTSRPHPWCDRSYILHVGISARGVHEARIIPVECRDRRVSPSEGWRKRELLGGMSALGEALHDEDRLAMLETDRTIREGRDLARRVVTFVERGDVERVGEVAGSLRVPRSRALVEALSALPDGSGAQLAPVLCEAADGDGTTVLMHAARDGRLQAAAGMLDASAHLSLEPRGRTP
jgi:poly-gamma-glutamate synthesis protein (capsule biosynthesis protein)